MDAVLTPDSLLLLISTSGLSAELSDVLSSCSYSDDPAQNGSAAGSKPWTKPQVRQMRNTPCVRGWTTLTDPHHYNRILDSPPKSSNRQITVHEDVPET